MRQDKCIQEFVVPRERVTPEVARVFQSILVSLRNLERKIQALPADSAELPALRAELQDLKRTLQRSKQEVRVDRRPSRDPEIQYSSEFS